MKLFGAKKEQVDPARLELEAHMKKTSDDLRAVYANFDSVTDEDLIDRYIFEMNAVLKRYKYLKEQADTLQ